MGLDQHAYILDKEGVELFKVYIEHYSLNSDDSVYKTADDWYEDTPIKKQAFFSRAKKDFYWGKHYPLFKFMKEKYDGDSNEPTSYINLDKRTVNELMSLVMDTDLNFYTPSNEEKREKFTLQGGYYKEDNYTHHREEDMEFVLEAKNALVRGDVIIYQHNW